MSQPNQPSIPSIHLNGTSGDELFRQNADAAAAVRKAIDALANARPHGRDFYPQGADALRVAQAAHDARVAHLTTVRDELYLLLEGIQDQLTGRGR